MLGLAPLFVVSSSLTSCATTHLWEWGMDPNPASDDSVSEVERAIIKPGATVFATPFAFAWDVITFPFQLGFGVYPYDRNYVDPR